MGMTSQRQRLYALAAGGALLGVAFAFACGGGDDGARPPDGGDGGDQDVEPDDLDSTTDAPADAGCAADVRVDPHNCGRCGRDCRGTECRAGLCAPEIVATALLDPWYLALDDFNVYWTDLSGGGVIRVDKEGKTAPIHVAVKQGAPWDVDVDDTTVFWTCSDGGAVMQAPKLADGGQTTPFWSGPDASALEIAVDDGWVYWTVDGAGVYRAPKDGGAATLVTAGAADGLALDGTRVYWTEHLSKGRIMAADKGGGAEATLAAGQTSPSRLAIDDANVYWVSDTSDAIAMVAKGGGPVTVLAQGSRVILGGLAVDDTWVYWANSGAGSIARVRKAPPHDQEILAQGLTVPVSVAVDATHLYFTNRGGTLLRVAK
jgi:Domain of unknown function (DUF5050)